MLYIMHPWLIPENPRSVIAHPMMNTTEVGANPEIRMPISKIAMLIRNIDLTS
jgi:hypothetical protein